MPPPAAPERSQPRPEGKPKPADNLGLGTPTADPYHSVMLCPVMTSQPGCSSLNLASFSAFMQTMVFMQKCEWSLEFSRNNYAVCVTGLSCNGLQRARQLRESRDGLTSIVRGLLSAKALSR